MNTKIIIAALIFTATSFSASAQTAARPSTLKHDRARVRQGVKSGELTKKETAKLAVQGAQVRQERKDYRQDGVVTPGERKDLRKDKRNLSKNIYKQKHDGQTRP